MLGLFYAVLFSLLVFQSSHWGKEGGFFILVVKNVMFLLSFYASFSQCFALICCVHLLIRYDQEIPISHTADQPTAPRAGATEQ